MTPPGVVARGYVKRPPEASNSARRRIANGTSTGRCHDGFVTSISGYDHFTLESSAVRPRDERGLLPAAFSGDMTEVGTAGDSRG